MKKFLLILLAVTAALFVLSNVGPMILLVASLALAYYAVKKFILADGVAEKVIWGFIILIGLSISLANVPALIAVAAVAILYYAYKAYKAEKEETILDMEEPGPRFNSKSEYYL